MQNIVVFGASGALGQAFCHLLSHRYPAATLHAVSRHSPVFTQANICSHCLNFDSEIAIAELMVTVTTDHPLDLVIVAIGTLHESSVDIFPEKSFKSIHLDSLHRVFEVNAFLPMLLAKYTLPALNQQQRSVFAVLSARVGSISDNRLGGWYAYRGAKAALNMAVKNFGIEMSCKNSHAIVVALHPGTVDSELSKPFQKNVPPHKLFTPEQAASDLLTVITGLTHNDSGSILAWDGQQILP